MDLVIIVPEPGQEKEIGQRLTATIKQMGLHHMTLQWVTWPQTGFLVPIEVEHALHASEDEAEAPAPKKRGRNKKTVDSTDKVEEE